MAGLLRVKQVVSVVMSLTDWERRAGEENYCGEGNFKSSFGA